MMSAPVQIDITTAADFKGLFQTIIVRRFKNNVGIRYEMVETGDILKFDSFVALFNMADNKDYVRFPSTGPNMKNGEKFKAKKASQQAAAEIGINMLNEALRAHLIPNDLGESQDYYTSQAGVAFPGQNPPSSNGKAVYELVNKKDWKGHLQTALLRKYKGSVEIKYSFGQNVRTDEFEATVLLTHSDPLIGNCRIQGAPASTKKASEKTAAEKASVMIDSDTLVFTPLSDKTVKSPTSYSTGNESAQLLGTALRGLFGDNYTAPVTISPTTSPVLISLPQENGWFEKMKEEIDDGTTVSDTVEVNSVVESDISTPVEIVEVIEDKTFKDENYFKPEGLLGKMDKDSFRDNIDQDPFKAPESESVSKGLSFAFMSPNSDSRSSLGTAPSMGSPRSPSIQPPTIPSTSSFVAREISSASKPPKMTSVLDSDENGEVKQELSADSTAFFPEPAIWDRDFGLSVRPPPMKSIRSVNQGQVHGGRGATQSHGNTYRDRNDNGELPPPQGRGHTARTGRGYNQASNNYKNNTNFLKAGGKGIQGQSQREFEPSRGAPHYEQIRGRDTTGQRLPTLTPTNSHDGAEMDFNLNMTRDRKRRIGETVPGQVSHNTVGVHGRNEGSLHEDLVKMLEEAKKDSPFRPSTKQHQPENILEASPEGSPFRATIPDRSTEDKNIASTLSLPSPQARFLDGHSNSHQALLDHDSDSKNNMMSLEEELSGGHSEKKAPDWKGELQTFLARNCKDFPFKIEYNSEERVAGGKFVARVTITFDNKEEENRVVYGIPAVNKKSTERTAAGIALEMFHDRALVIPRLQANFTLNSNASTNGPFEGDAGKKWEHYCSPSANDYEGEKVGVKDYKGRLQMLLARRYRGVIFKICYDAPKSEDGIFKAMLMIIPQNVTDLALKICEGRSSRVKKISEQSVAETAVHMLEADILEVQSAASDKYRHSAIELAGEGANSETGLYEEWSRLEKVRRSVEQRKAKRNLNLNGERADNCAYFMENACFLFVKGGDLLSSSVVSMNRQDIKASMYRHRSRMDRTVPVLLSEPSIDWKNSFASSLMEKLYSQLESFCVPNKENELENEADTNAALDSLHLSISFGHSYFMNAEVCFESNTNISVEKVENALNSSVKNRATYERLDYDPSFVREKEGKSDKLEKLPTLAIYTLTVPPSLAIPSLEGNDGPDTTNTLESGVDLNTNETAGSSGISDALCGAMERCSLREKRRRWLASGFRRSVYPQRIIASVSPQEGSGIDTYFEGYNNIDSYFVGAGKWAEDLFLSLDYQVVPNAAEEGSSPVDSPTTPSFEHSSTGIEWRVEVIASAAYQADVRLNSSLEIRRVSERPLTWVHATLLGGKAEELKVEESATPVLENGSENEGSCIDTSETNTNTLESHSPVIPAVNQEKAAPMQAGTGLGNDLGNGEVENHDTATASQLAESVDTTSETNTSKSSIMPSEDKSITSSTNGAGVESVKQVPLHHHDVRIKVTTCKALKEGDALYQAACPLGLAPIEIDEASKKPIPSPRLKEGHRVVFARQMLSKRMFKHCYSVNVGESEEININTVAILSNCVHYEGEQLGEREPVIDLSLEVDLAPLITYLKERRVKGDEVGSRQGVDTFLTGVVDHIVALSNKIEES